jgi:hypothetical protein
MLVLPDSSARILYNLEDSARLRQSRQVFQLLCANHHKIGAFKGLVKQKNLVFNSFVCKLGSLWHAMP